MALICPLCKEENTDAAEDCSRCRTDLSLLQRTRAAAGEALRGAEERAGAGELSGASRLVAEARQLWPDPDIPPTLSGLLTNRECGEAEGRQPESRPVLPIGPAVLLIAGALVCGFGVGHL